eukprot:648917-Lingulodinium_polyedra.AAC.1
MSHRSAIPPHVATASRGSAALRSAVRACLALGESSFQSLLSAAVRPHAVRAPAVAPSDSVRQ